MKIKLEEKKNQPLLEMCENLLHTCDAEEKESFHGLPSTPRHIIMFQVYGFLLILVFR